MYRQYRAVTRLRVANIRPGKATTPANTFAIASRCCMSSISKIETLLPQTDHFPSRHIGLNPEAEKEMTNFLGFEVKNIHK